MTTSPLATFAFPATSQPDSLPTAVYVARDVGGSVIYVGMTGSLITRLNAHQKSNLWWPNAAEVTVEIWPDRAAAATREAQLIAQYEPLGNRFEARRRNWAQSRIKNEETLIEMYGAGTRLNEIAGVLNVSYNTCAGYVGRLLREGRLEPRPKPPGRPWPKVGRTG